MKPQITSIDISLALIFSNIITAFLENALVIVCGCLPACGPILSGARAAFLDPETWSRWLLPISVEKEMISKSHTTQSASCTGPKRNLNRYRWIEDGLSSHKVDSDTSCRSSGEGPYIPGDVCVITTVQSNFPESV